MKKINIKNSFFGDLPDNRQTRHFEFKTANGLLVGITNLGGTITSIKTPDRNGNLEEITVGFPGLEGYINNHSFVGCTIGRFANRISFGRFNIDNKTYSLTINNHPNHLHGGNDGFHSRLWDYSIFENFDSAGIRLSYLSPHMEGGYPGNLTVFVTYTIYENNELRIQYEAETDANTHINLTNHAYFNLGGFKNDIFDHQLFMDANHILELDENQIPTGKLLEIANTLFDYGPTHASEEQPKQIMAPMDNCFVLNPLRDNKKLSAVLYHPSSGRKLKLYTTQPGIQVYTSNHFDGSLLGHDNVSYKKHYAICLETQHFPDTPNHPDFPSTLIKPGEKYIHTARFVFE